MKTTLKFSLSMLLIAAIVLSCRHQKEEVDPPYLAPPPNLIACHNAVTWDSAAIQNVLIGEWNWEYIRCFWSPEKTNYDDFKGTTIEFNSDGTLVVTENGQTTQTSTWNVISAGNGSFAINTTPNVYLVYGRILYCDDRVEFMDSYVDGCDNYFKRKN
jgi:hypothetical protein